MGEQIVVRSPLSLEQVHDRLVGEVDPESWFGVIWDRGTARDCDFVGQIRPSSFSIRRRRRLEVTTANPLVLGSLARLPTGGTVITGWFPRDVLQRIIGLPVVVLGIAYVPHERDVALQIAEVVLLVAIVLVLVAPGGLGKRQVRELLEELATPRETWRPYERRAE